MDEGPAFDIESAIEMRMERRPLREIADVVGVSVSTLGYWFNKLHIKVPPAPKMGRKLSAAVDTDTHEIVHATAAERGYESTAEFMREAVKEKIHRGADK